MECAFGRIKARWRILIRPIDVNVKNVPIFILSCFALHNYCEKCHVSVDQTSSENIVIDEERRFVNKIDKLKSHTTNAGNKSKRNNHYYLKECL